ncbi:MAG TPA: Hint domain-containing protein, partial [Rhodopila sp.]
AGNRLVVYATGVFNGVVDEGSNATLELHSSSSAGTIANFGVSFTNFATMQFDPGSDWSVSGPGADLSGKTFSGFGDGDTIDLTGFTASSISTLSGNTGVVLFGASSSVLLNFTTSISSFGFTTGPSGTDVTMCFLPGTLIRTPHGEVKVEELVAGDTVCTLHHRGSRPITWIGKGKVLATRGRRGPATPVVIRKDAFADNVPYADLHVTKAHGFYFDGVLIPVEFLVNHRTIAWDDEAKEVTLYHIELDAHDVLFANGAPAESFRDDGNRWLFHNAHEITQSALEQSCLPVLTGGAIVDAAWQRLLDRAGARPSPPTTDDPDVHLLIDGVRLDAHRRLGAMLVFHLRHRPRNLRIVSRHAVPAELGLSRDPRRLGVAIRQVVLTRGPRMAIVDAYDDRLTQGFHDYEPDEGIRWTSGDATLPHEAFAGFAENTMLELHLGGATTYRLLPEAAAA